MSPQGSNEVDIELIKSLEFQLSSKEREVRIEFTFSTPQVYTLDTHYEVFILCV